MLSKHRPKACIYAFSRNVEVCNRMNALWGVTPIHKTQWNSAEEMVTSAEKELLPKGVIRKGDVLGLVAGTRLTSGATNFMRLHTVGEAERPAAKRRSKGK
jgi:pyruvate kinase